MFSTKRALVWGLMVAGMVAGAAPAFASPIDTFSGSLTFSDTSSPLNNLTSFAGTFTHPTFSFAGGVATTYSDLLSVNATDLNLSNATNTDAVAIAINFTSPNVVATSIGGSASLTDTFNLRGFYYSDTGSIVWSSLNDPTTITFSDGSVLGLSIGNIALTGSNGSAFGSSPLVLTVEKVPEPFTLSIFGAGLLGAGAFRRRARKLS